MASLVMKGLIDKYLYLINWCTGFRVLSYGVVLILGVLCTHQANAQCSFIANPGFESGLATWTNTGAPGSALITTVSPYAGVNALHFPVGQVSQIYTPLVGFSPGTSYKLEGYHRTTNIAPCYITVEWFDASNVFISSTFYTFQPNIGPWSKFTRWFVPPPTAVSGQLLIRKSSVAGDLFLDELCISPSGLNCDMLPTITNASNGYTADGSIVINNLLLDGYLSLKRPDGSSIRFVTVVANSVGPTGVAQFLGLLPGVYELDYAQYDAYGGVACTGKANFTVGANALPTCVTTAIGGQVYGDYDQNGQRSNHEAGISGVIVNAYNSAGLISGSSPATTSANGNYQITGLTAGQPYRLEFSWPDQYIKPGAIGTSAGTVQFVNSGVCTAHLGLNYPADYCHTANPYLTMPCYINGDPTAPAIAPLDALVMTTLNSSTLNGVSSQVPALTHISTAGQIGSVWAQAYQRSTKYMYTGAMMRRFMGFGPLGTGGIYKINLTTPTAPVTSNWIDLKTIGINTGNDTRDGTPANTLSINPASPTYDAEAFNQVGKVGIGGMDFSEYGDTLWFMNLFDKKLYGIKNVQPGVTPTAADILGGFTVTLPSGFSCASNASELRPWAVKYYKGKVYVGVVCSGELTPWNENNIRGFVLSIDPNNTAAGFQHVLNMPLGYQRGDYGATTSTFWPWGNNTVYSGYFNAPILSDLEFDVNGDLILGYADRGGFQTGDQNYFADPTATNTTLIEGGTRGEIIRACKTATGFVREGLPGCPLPSYLPINDPHAGSEYYFGENGPWTNNYEAFQESSGGSLAQVPVGGVVVVSAQDPSDYFAGGTISLNNKTGSDNARFTIYDATIPGGSGKSAGIGDIEPLCDLAPIEIGERVFLDTDGDGIQDAGEPGIGSVGVSLFRTSDNVLIGSTFTGPNGVYKFTNLAKNTGYYLSINASLGPLSAYFVSPVNSGSNDLIDSDGTKIGVFVRHNFTTELPGFNNHSYDFGFTPCAPTTVSLGPDQTICPDPVTLNAVVTGGVAPFTYTWSSGGSTTSSNTVSPITTTTYSVTVTYSTVCNVTGSVTVTVQPDPIVTISGAQDVCLGGTITLTANVTGGIGTNNYQWQRRISPSGGWANVGTNASTYATDAGLAADSYDYQVIVTQTGAGCNATSAIVQANVIADPIINIVTASGTVCLGGTVTLTANATGGTGTCTLQWQQNTGSGWTNIAGATGANYNTPALTTNLDFRAVYSCAAPGCCN
jgi:hypothetical protein